MCVSSRRLCEFKNFIDFSFNTWLSEESCYSQMQWICSSGLGNQKWFMFLWWWSGRKVSGYFTRARWECLRSPIQHFLSYILNPWFLLEKLWLAEIRWLKYKSFSKRLSLILCTALVLLYFCLSSQQHKSWAVQSAAFSMVPFGSPIRSVLALFLLQGNGQGLRSEGWCMSVVPKQASKQPPQNPQTPNAAVIYVTGWWALAAPICGREIERDQQATFNSGQANSADKW